MVIRRCALLLASAACVDAAPCGEPAPTTLSAGSGGGGNVLIVVLDDVGSDQLARFEPAEVVAETPTIDCLCDRGVRFRQAWASAMCSPTRSELMTGRYNRRTGIGQILNNDAPAYELPESEHTLGEVAQEAGLSTAFFGKWHLASETLPDAPTHPERSGFDHFAGVLANLRNSVSVQDRKLGYETWEKVVDGGVGITHAYPTTDNVDDALDTIEHADGPWVVILSFNAAHEPLHEPPRRLLDHGLPKDATDRELYRAMVEAADHELGRLLRRLEPAVLADTTVILLGDNGSPSSAIGRPYDDRRSKGTMFEGGLRIPLLVTGPHVAAPGESSDALVHVVDLLPTVADLWGVSPGEATLDGLSLVPALTDPGGAAIHDTVASFLYTPVGSLVPKDQMLAFRDGDHKLVMDGPRDRRLYRVEAGVLDEGPDLLAEAPDAGTIAIADALQARLEALEATFP